MQKDYAKLLLDFKSIPEKKRTKTFMEITGYPHYENVCSNILKFYLDPNEEHGLKDLVLISLLQLFDAEFKFDFDFEDIEIKREHKTVKGNRLDLLILTKRYSIGIENKIFHHLNNDLADYYNTINSYNPHAKTICIVLSLNKLAEEDREKMNDNNFVNITYEQLFNNIKQNIGRYINRSNFSYVNYLTDFIKSIENLIPKTMENKELWAFLKQNSETIQELTESFQEYKNSLYQKIGHLKEELQRDDFAPLSDSQWISQESCLVIDYTIQGKYKIAVDTSIDIYSLKIELFGRDSNSSEFLYSKMFKDKTFLPNESYEIRNQRLLYQKFDSDIEISTVIKTLTELLGRIENFKKNIEANNDK